MSTRTRFYDKAGWLTPYAMACGYIHMTEDSTTETRVRLWCANSETGQYDVSIVIGGIRTQWEAFGTVGQARRFYRRNVARLFGSLRHRYEAHPDVARSVII